LFGLSQSEKNAALHKAVDDGDVEGIRRAIKRGADPEYSTYNYGPMIFRAVGHYTDSTAAACVKALLECGAKIGATNKSGYTPLHYALARPSSNLELVEYLIDAGADVNVTDQYGTTPLMVALAHKHWPGADLVLDHLPAAAGKGENEAALCCAVNAGASRKLLGKIIQKVDIDVNLRYTNNRISALHAAINGGQVKTVEWLLERKGINVDLPTAKRESPLLLAVQAGRMDMVRPLLAAGAKPNTKDEEGQTPLTVAARTNSQEIVEALIAAKAALDAPDKAGMSALTIAAQGGSIRLVRTLLAAAEAAGQKLVLGPALFAAAENGNGRILELLLGAGADANATDKDGRTPLMKAAGSDSAESLAILIKAGAKPDTADRNGMFAYDFAVAAKKMKAKDFLGRYRHEELKAAEAANAGSAADYHYVRLNDHSLEVREGDGLTMTFNFWTQQIIFRDTERPAPVTVQNFADLQRQEAIEEAYQKLKELGGNPPDPRIFSMQKKMPGLGK
jgi:uncharacterized protein